MPRGRPKKENVGSEKILHQKFWIWDSIWEEPREVEIKSRQVNERGEFLCWDSYEVEARGSNNTRFLHQIFSKSQLFPTKNALCKHYIKMFEKFMDQEEQK